MHLANPHPSLSNEPLESAHELYVGGTGSAKTTRALQQFLKIIGQGKGGCFMAPTRDALDMILMRLSSNELARTHIIDPCNPENVAGINILDAVNRSGLLPEDDIAFKSIYMLDGVRDAFGEDALQVRSGSILKELVGIMLGSNLHAATCFLLWDPEREGLNFRQKAYPKVRAINPFYEAYISRNIDPLEPHGRHQMLEASLNKMKVLFDTPALTCALLQPKPTLDLEKIISNNEILLIDLSTAYLGEDGMRILGSFLLSTIYMTAVGLHTKSSREKEFWPVFCDEFQEYFTSTILVGLAQARKLGLFFSLICQDSSRVEARFPGAWETILANTVRKYVFNVADESTLKTLVSHMFGYDPKWQAGVGNWSAQKELWSAMIPCLPTGHYYYQNCKMIEQTAAIDGQIFFARKSVLESTGNGKPDMPEIKEPTLEGLGKRRQAIIARDSQKKRSDLYKEIMELYRAAVLEAADKNDPSAAVVERKINR